MSGIYRRCGDIYLVPVCCFWPLSLLLQRRGAPTDQAQWRTWNKIQSRKAEVSRAIAEVAIFLAITEENCRVCIGGAATFTWYRCAASGHCRCYFSAEGAPANQAQWRTCTKKNRAKSWG